MIKEIIICVAIVGAILIGNNTTQNFTKQTIDELTSDLQELRTEIKNENVNEENTQSKVDQMDNDWNKIHEILAYYIEHDEIEKVETNLVSIKSYIETKQYEEATNELDKNAFVLSHIEDKYQFNLKNIF